jgi:hypothetical protein
VAIATRSAGVRIVALDRIVCDKRAFPRVEIDAARVDEFASLYREELLDGNDPLPAIGCVEDRDGRLVLYDGWHRVAARRRVAAEYPGRGYDELAAEVVHADGRDAVDYAYELAVGCSAVGSKQLTRLERFMAAKRLSEIDPSLSIREIARRTGVSHQTVLRARASASLSGGGPNGPLAPSDNGDAATSAVRRSPSLTLEQRAYRTGVALCRLFEQARDESRGMLGFGKPHMRRAGAAAYRALEHSYGEDAPAVLTDLLALVDAMRDQSRSV